MNIEIKLLLPAITKDRMMKKELEGVYKNFWLNYNNKQTVSPYIDSPLHQLNHCATALGSDMLCMFIELLRGLFLTICVVSYYIN